MVGIDGVILSVHRCMYASCVPKSVVYVYADMHKGEHITGSAGIMRALFRETTVSLLPDAFLAS